MADRSQHPGQIMEAQTRCDLTTAIETWLMELAAQPNFKEEIRRELETHLRDAIAGFKQRCLKDEESFWHACKRVGQPPRLGEEFVKTDNNGINIYMKKHLSSLVFGCVCVCVGLTLSYCDFRIIPKHERERSLAQDQEMQQLAKLANISLEKQSREGGNPRMPDSFLTNP
jgi:hypothetical protein